MHTPESVEVILARLMPPALSEEGQHGIEAMLDELAGEAPVEMPIPKRSSRPWSRRLIVGGIAAAAVGMAVLFPTVDDGKFVSIAEEREVAPDFVLVSESGRIESSSDEGWVEDSDGTTMRALRLSVIEEESIRDEETGIVMQVSEPREDILLMPVSAF